MKRVRALQDALTERGEAAALITSPENIRYVTGYYVWNNTTPFALAVVPASGDPDCSFRAPTSPWPAR